MAVVLSWSTARAEETDISALLQKGPVVLVEEDDGRFAQATAIIEIAAPPERVWATLLAMERFKEFMPKVTTSDVTQVTAHTFDVRLVYDIPGPDTDYTARMEVDAGGRTVTGRWLRDDLQGSSWTWKIVATAEGRTLLFHTVRVKNFSPLLRQVEDDQQTVTVGVNVSSALATVKALKRRSEEAYAAGR